MLKEYLKIIARNSLKNKYYTFINIFGLAVGISATVLIALFVEDELSFDAYHEDAERIYRVTTVLDFNGPLDAALTNFALAPTLKQDYPEVESFARFFGGQQEYEVTVNDVRFQESNIWFADSTTFEVFTYNFIAGDPSTALTAPNSLVLTDDVALKWFGTLDCMDEEVKINNSFANVKGIIETPPNNSEIPVQALYSISTIPPQSMAPLEQDWFRISLFSFLKLTKPTSPAEFKVKLDEVNEKYVLPWAEANGIVASQDYSITPLADVHFDNSHGYDLPKGNINNIYIFIALASFLLLIAAFNYINLTLAQQGKRRVEVGVRKTLGASKASLVTQFMIESILFTLIGLILGLALTELFLSSFNELSGKEISSLDLFQPSVMTMLIGITLLLGLLAGAYPAFVLSSLKPVQVLSGSKSNTGKVGALRKVLILLQFLFSIFMISATFLIDDQMNYIRSMNLGFDRENLITVALPSDTTARKIISPWVEDLQNDSRIVEYSRSALPTGRTAELMFRIEKEGVMTETAVKCLFVDENFVDVLGLDLIQGRNFSPEITTDVQSGFIVNQTGAEVFGWADEPLNKRVQWGLLENGQAQYDGNVIGLVNDFNFLSLHNAMDPLILCYNQTGGANLSIRFDQGDY
ncbi:MAG: ABC transporter permease, partial [Flavobacteriales bacterium]|nr:ABC transporter permease [Flavobacteriales bacterium]